MLQGVRTTTPHTVETEQHLMVMVIKAISKRIQAADNSEALPARFSSIPVLALIHPEWSDTETAKETPVSSKAGSASRQEEESGHFLVLVRLQIVFNIFSGTNTSI